MLKGEAKDEFGEVVGREAHGIYNGLRQKIVPFPKL